jgi:hypothetical protein
MARCWAAPVSPPPSPGLRRPPGPAELHLPELQRRERLPPRHRGAEPGAEPPRPGSRDRLTAAPGEPELRPLPRHAGGDAPLRRELRGGRTRVEVPDHGLGGEAPADSRGVRPEDQQGGRCRGKRARHLLSPAAGLSDRLRSAHPQRVHGLLPPRRHARRRRQDALDGSGRGGARGGSPPRPGGLDSGTARARRPSGGLRALRLPHPLPAPGWAAPALPPTWPPACERASRLAAGSLPADNLPTAEKISSVASSSDRRLSERHLLVRPLPHPRAGIHQRARHGDRDRGRTVGAMPRPLQRGLPQAPLPRQPRDPARAPGVGPCWRRTRWEIRRSVPWSRKIRAAPTTPGSSSRAFPDRGLS